MQKNKVKKYGVWNLTEEKIPPDQKGSKQSSLLSPRHVQLYISSLNKCHCEVEALASVQKLHSNFLFSSCFCLPWTPAISSSIYWQHSHLFSRKIGPFKKSKKNWWICRSQTGLLTHILLIWCFYPLPKWELQHYNGTLPLSDLTSHAWSVKSPGMHLLTAEVAHPTTNFH